jgi:hypothetical protein
MTEDLWAAPRPHSRPTNNSFIFHIKNSLQNKLNKHVITSKRKNLDKKAFFYIAANWNQKPRSLVT